MTSNAPAESRRVLVVDDNLDLAENVAELFADVGCVTSIATSFDTAVRALEEQCVDLAVVDIRLGGASGVELAGLIKQRYPQAEVILMTANASLDTAIAAVRGEAYAYVQKPFDPEELLTLGERALGAIHLRRERQRLEGELAQSEALYRGVVDEVDAFIVGLGETGEIRMWNRSAEQATGFASRDVLGKPMASLLLTDRNAAQLRDAVNRALNGDESADVELPVTSREGTSRVVRWHFSSLPSGAAAGPRVLAVGMDLTDRLDLERRAAEAEAMASLGTLTAGLAHEIRNPLNAAVLQLELLQRSADRLVDADQKERIRERAAIVCEELERLAHLLSDFLNLAKPRAIALVPVDLRALVHEVVRSHEPAVKQAGLEICTEFDEGPLRAIGDESMLKQVLVNLILNSIDAMRAGGRGHLLIGCHRSSEARLTLSVQDDGPGIPDEVGEMLFTPFVTSKPAGTGLGLTIVKRIVDRHGGSIQVVSSKQKGTEIRVSLPSTR